MEMFISISDFWYEQVETKVFSTHKYWVETNHGTLLDIGLGHTSFIFGFNNSDISESAWRVSSQIGFVNSGPKQTCDINIELAKKLCAKSGMHSLVWSVSGTDGVEAALSANDLYWKQVDQRKKLVISFTPGYHGSSFICRALRDEESMPDKVKTICRDVWETELERQQVEKNTLLKLTDFLKANSHQVGAVIMESVPWNMGMAPWSTDWWKSIRSICDEFNLNFILDDVFGGVGKLGHVFSHTRYGVQPDIVVLGKALTNGLIPLSCAVMNQRIADTVEPHWNYGHTWQPNMSGVGAALAVMDHFDESKIVQIEKKLNELAQQFLESKLIKNFRCVGLLLEISVNFPVTHEKILSSGLSSRPFVLNRERVQMCAPIIADDEYWVELEKRLLTFLKNDQDQ